MENNDETTPALVLEEGEISDHDEKREEREEPIPKLILTRHPKVEHTSSRKVFTSIFQRLEREGRVEELPR